MATKITDGVLKRQYEFQGKPSDPDVSAALQKFIIMLDEKKALGYIGPGDYTLLSPVQITFGSTRWGLLGAGKGVTRFIVPASNTDGAFIFNSTLRTNQVKFRDFTVLGQGIHEHGLTFNQPHGGNIQYRTVEVHNVDIRSANRTTQYFNRYFTFEGSWRALLHNTIAGEAPGSLPREDGSILYAPMWNYGLDGGYAPQINFCYGFGATTGVRSKVYDGAISAISDNGDGTVRLTFSNPPHQFSTGSGVVIKGTANYDGKYTATNIPSSNLSQIDITATFAGTSAIGTCVLEQAGEAIQIFGSVINGVRTGLNFVRPAGREPIVWMTDTHINYLVSGMDFDGAQLITGKGNVIYNEESDAGTTQTAVDFRGRNVSRYMWTGNFHHIGEGADRIVFQLSDDGSAGSGDLGKINDNMITDACDIGIVAGAGVSRLEFMGNKFEGAPATAVSQDFDNANYLQTDLEGREMAGTWTPPLTFGGGTTGLTFTSRSGKWTMCGNKLHLEIQLVVNTVGTSSGTAIIGLPTALPGPFSILAERGWVDWTFYSGMTSLSVPGGRVTSSAGLRLINRTASGVADITNANFANGSIARIAAVLDMG